MCLGMRMNRTDATFLGAGIYSVSEAARLTKVPSARVRRWLQDYSFESQGRHRESKAVWIPQLPRIGGQLGLGFRDLLEIRFVDAFVRAGVTWPTVRKAAEKAADLLNATHPFSTFRFKTDGRLIFADVSGAIGDTSLLELTKSQHYFARIIRPYLRGIEFCSDEPVRWWPLGNRRCVVLDPQRAFGQPIIASRGVPTAVLAQAMHANGSAAQVARWFETDVNSVRDALDFEEHLAA